MVVLSERGLQVILVYALTLGVGKTLDLQVQHFDDEPKVANEYLTGVA